MFCTLWCKLTTDSPITVVSVFFIVLSAVQPIDNAMRARPDLMLICAAAVVLPVHVVTSPPLEREVEEKIMSELNRANELIVQHKQESSVVFDRMRRLNDVDEYTRKTIKILLTDKFQTVLLQQGVLENVATRVASLWALITVLDIHLEIITRGE